MGITLFQANDEAAKFTLLALYINLSMVHIYQAFGKRQSYACSGLMFIFIITKECLKNLIEVLLTNAPSGVFNNYLNNIKEYQHF